MGKASKEQREEFIGEVERFRNDIGETLKSLVGGVELRKPEKKYDVDIEEKILKRSRYNTSYEKYCLIGVLREEYLEEKQTEQNNGGTDEAR